MQSGIRCALAGACLVAVGFPAAAELRWDNASGGSVQLYGQFNPAGQYVDDGVASYSELVDNANSNSRVGLWVRQPMGGGNFTFNLESALGFRQSSQVTQGFTPKGVNWQRISIRKVDFSWSSDEFGAFYIGQGSMSHDGAAESDLSGTSLAGYNWIAGAAGAFRFRTAAGALTTRTIALAMPNFDGGRRGRIRYDTPSFGGFRFSVSYGTEVLVQNSDLESASAALHYSQDFGDWKMRGALAYGRVDPGLLATNLHDTIGSFSALHASGFNVTVAAGNQKETGDYAYGKLGYQGDWFGVGTTAVSLDYYSGRDMTAGAGSKSSSLGVQMVQNFDAPGIEAYLGWRDYSLSETATAYRDMSSVLIGARWKF